MARLHNCVCTWTCKYDGGAFCSDSLCPECFKDPDQKIREFPTNILKMELNRRKTAEKAEEKAKKLQNLENRKSLLIALLETYKDTLCQCNWSTTCFKHLLPQLIKNTENEIGCF